jgi:cobalt-zinc-cadmium efflux system protein
VILATGWPYTDAVVALALAAFIVPRALGLAREALRIVVQAAPASVDVEALTQQLAALPSVNDVHDVHVWTLTSGMDVASVHLVSEQAHTADVVRAAQAVLQEHGLAHATVQVEDDAGGTCGSEW